MGGRSLSYGTGNGNDRRLVCLDQLAGQEAQNGNNVLFHGKTIRICVFFARHTKWVSPSGTEKPMKKFERKEKVNILPNSV